MPHTLFVSYSHKDEKHKDFVVDHLKVAERQGVFDVWEDRRIKGGGDWLAEIDQALSKADIAVLLISKHFLTSDFIMDHEVQTMLQRHASDDVILYPILISDCAWQTVDWLQAINIRPTDGNPLSSFNEAERDQVMADLALEIGQLHHPAEDRTTTRPRAVHQHRRSSANGGVLVWWRSASLTARATVLGTAFAGLTLVWSIITVNIPSDRLSSPPTIRSFLRVVDASDFSCADGKKSGTLVLTDTVVFSHVDDEYRYSPLARADEKSELPVDVEAYDLNVDPEHPQPRSYKLDDETEYWHYTFTLKDLTARVRWEWQNQWRDDINSVGIAAPETKENMTIRYIFPDDIKRDTQKVEYFPSNVKCTTSLYEDVCSSYTGEMRTDFPWNMWDSCVF